LARNYKLAHAFHTLGLYHSFDLFLSVVLNESLAEDKDVRNPLVLLARATEPRNARMHTNSYGHDYEERYKIYIEELKKLALQSI
jgi:hypothetical protein